MVQESMGTVDVIAGKECTSDKVEKDNTVIEIFEGSENKCSALILALKGKAECIKYLFSKEPDNGGKNENGYTSLSIEAWHGNLESLKELLLKKENLNVNFFLNCFKYFSIYRLFY